MASLFSGILSARTQQQQGKFQGQQMAQQLEERLVAQQQAAEQRRLEDLVKQSTVRKNNADADKTTYEIEHPKEEAPRTLETASGIMQWDPAQKKYVPTGLQAYHPPVQPRNIDPLSEAGIAAQRKIKGGANGVMLPAPLAAKVGQFGEMLKKGSDLLPAMEALDVALGSSAAQDIAEHGIGVGHARLPGTSGLGSRLLNRTPEYARYQAALSPFVLAAAHALSGARINDTQVAQIRASIEIKPGDGKAVRAQKHKNLIDLVNSIGGSLPPVAIAEQEDQMDPQSIQLMRGYGYRGANRPTAEPTADGNGTPPATGNTLKLKNGKTIRIPD